MQFNYLCSFSNHVNAGKGPRQIGWNTFSLFTDSLMAKKPAGLSQDVGCLSSVVQSQEKKKKSLLLSKGDAANVQEAAKLEVISLDTALALSTGVGPACPTLYRG